MTDVEDIYELTPMQHGMLHDSVVAGDTGMYSIQLEYVLRGRLRVPEFERAWDQTVANHAILRTSFHWEGLAKPLQVVHTAVDLTTTVEDWSHLTPEEQAARATSVREEDRRRGFDFATAPLVRIGVFRTGAESFRVLWSFHHILMEGWSAAIVLDEVLTRYRSLVQRRPLHLPPQRPYREFVAWLQQQDLGRAEGWWGTALAGAQHPTHLGIDRGSPGLQAPATRYGERSIRLQPALASALSSFARGHGLTLNTLFQGAWAVLLFRYSGEEDVVFGSVVSGRSAPLHSINTMVGLFVNSLPTRLRIQPACRVVDWLKDVQTQQVQQRRFESSSLAQIKEWSGWSPGLPLFEYLLVFENWRGELVGNDWGDGLELCDVQGYHVGAGYPLTIVIAPGNETTVTATYDMRRFEPEAVERLLGNFEVLLEGVAAGPEARVAELPFLTSAERTRVLRQWNGSATVVPDHTLHGLFEAQVARTPDAEAIVWEHEALTYAGLERRANRLAHYLVGLGVECEVLVGVCLPRSLDMVVTLLAILKAGGAYVPLDPDYPHDRQAFMLEDSGADVVVTQSGLAGRLRHARVRVVCLDELDDAIVARSGRPPFSAATAKNLAYVIYTSGSTGRPKGAAIKHRSLVNLIEWARGVYGPEELSGVLCSTSICFDLSTFELFLPLTSGGRVFLAENALALPRIPRREEVRLLNSVPSALSALAAADAIPRTVTTVNAAGERLPTDLVDELYGKGVRRVCDLYGPSETTTYSTYALRAVAGPETVGHPLSNTWVYLLDCTLEPVPEGAVGEVHVGGAGVARGYLNRPGLTAERFVPDPFTGPPGARMYRTGDLARYLADGSLQLLGRMDHQVKVRGFRIEPGEVESALRRHPSLSEVAVVAREDASHTTCLVAYCIPAGPTPPDENVLRTHLRAWLPDVMVPSAWVWVPDLPCTPNGKLDRGRLPSPQQLPGDGSADFVHPRTSTEKTLASIWQHVLEVDRIGARDNFFDLGGHSLLLLPIISEIEKQLGVRLDPGDLVRPTLAQLSSLCDDLRAKEKTARHEGIFHRVVRAIGSLPSGSSGKGTDPSE